MIDSEHFNLKRLFFSSKLVFLAFRQHPFLSFEHFQQLFHNVYRSGVRGDDGGGGGFAYLLKFYHYFEKKPQ